MDTIFGKKNFRNEIIWHYRKWPSGNRQFQRNPDCPYCKDLHVEIKKVVAERKDIAFYKKMFPFKVNTETYEKSKTIVCEKSLELLENAFDKKPIHKAKCETTAVDENVKLAEKLGITGTPTMIMPDGRVISGKRDAKTLKELVDKK